MPKIKIDHVMSFSSEDPVHVANNILTSDPAKKWKCKDAGERSASIVLQLEKATIISGIDIGNENSAYVEVLVTRSGTTEDYKVLLVMSSFMTPLEARQSTNINKVRLFTQEQLSTPEREQKWDRIKIVCTQPFNRHVQYGLSFITFHSPGEKGNGPAVPVTIGKFALRPASPDNLSIGSLFARRTELQKQSLSPAAAIREASVSTPSPKIRLKINGSVKKGDDGDGEVQNPVARNRNELLYKEDEEKPNDKIDKVVEKMQKEAKERKAKEEAQREKEAKEKKAKDEAKRVAKNEARQSVESSKRKQPSESSSSPKKKAKISEKQRKPFPDLLKDVTLVISGIQNPDRGKLRTMALSMGAKYKPDWDNSCTHLICAFANTPKFNQVKGVGKIVKRSWLEECHSQRKRLPWRRFCLDKNDAKQPESEDEIWEQVIEEKSIELDDSTDEEGYDDLRMQQKIEEIQAKQREQEALQSTIFTVETDDEIEQSPEVQEFPKTLPEFLDFKTFFIDETLDEEVARMLERYIIAYKGIVADNPSEDVDYFVTTELNAENLRKYNSESLCVRPDWLWDCHNKQSLVSTDGYVL